MDCDHGIGSVQWKPALTQKWTLFLFLSLLLDKGRTSFFSFANLPSTEQSEIDEAAAAAAVADDYENDELLKGLVGRQTKWTEWAEWIARTSAGNGQWPVSSSSSSSSHTRREQLPATKRPSPQSTLFFSLCFVKLSSRQHNDHFAIGYLPHFQANTRKKGCNRQMQTDRQTDNTAEHLVLQMHQKCSHLHHRDWLCKR